MPAIISGIMVNVFRDEYWTEELIPEGTKGRQESNYFIILSVSYFGSLSCLWMDYIKIITYL